MVSWLRNHAVHAIQSHLQKGGDGPISLPQENWESYEGREVIKV